MTNLQIMLNFINHERNAKHQRPIRFHVSEWQNDTISENSVSARRNRQSLLLVRMKTGPLAFEEGSLAIYIKAKNSPSNSISRNLSYNYISTSKHSILNKNFLCSSLCQKNVPSPHTHT